MQTQYRTTTPPPSVVVSQTPPYGGSSSSYANGQGSSHSYTSTPAVNHGYGQQPQGYQGQYPQQQQQQQQQQPVAYSGYPSTYGSGQDVPTPPIQTPSPNLTDTLASIPDEQKVRPQFPFPLKNRQR